MRFGTLRPRQSGRIDETQRAPQTALSLHQDQCKLGCQSARRSNDPIIIRIVSKAGLDGAAGKTALPQNHQRPAQLRREMLLH